MRPLSNRVYFFRNKRRTAPLLLVVALAVVGVSVISVVANSQFASSKFAWLEQYEHYAIVTGAQGFIPATIVERLESYQQVARVIPYDADEIRVPTLLGTVNTAVLGLQPDEIEWVIEQSDLRLVRGTLPEPGQAQIVLHESIMRSRDLEIGSLIGSDIDDREFLRGTWEVVGVLAGPIQIAIAPKDAVRSRSALRGQEGEASYLVFPADGQMAAVDAIVQSLPRDEVIPFTFNSMNDVFQKEFDSAKIVIWIIDIVTISVLAVASGLLNHIYFMQRISEYGTLAAIGYRISHLVERALSEVMALTLVAWGLGLLLAQGVTLLISDLFFAPRGYELQSLDLQAIYFTIPIPIMIAGFSFITVIRQLYRLDPVTIVERRD